MATVVKVTKRENFNAIIEVLKSAEKNDLVKVMEHEIELLDNKRASKSKSESKTSKVNMALAEQIVDILKATPGLTATQIGKAMEQRGAIAEMGNQKATAVMRPLVESGEIIRDKSGKTTLFYAKSDLDVKVTLDDTVEVQ